MSRIVICYCALATLTLAPMTANAAEPAALKSLSVDLPESDNMFAGPGAEPANNNCLACHSTEMILNQPPLAKPVWEGIVHKMINVYKAPVEEKDVGPIVDYLSSLPSKKQ